MIFSRQRSVLPGFKMTLGFTLFYLSLIVLIPLVAIFTNTATLSWAQFRQVAASPEAMASYRLTFGASLGAALVNAVFGLIVAWVLVRYQFFGKRLLDALVDLPFALPTAVAGITLARLYADDGWIGHVLNGFGVKVANTQLGVLVALIFIGLPFIVRTIQPVLEDLDTELEEAAASLGANRWQIFWRVIFPMLKPAVLTGIAMAFARALGEYGSVIFIAGNLKLKTIITPVLIMNQIDMFQYGKATALAAVLLIVSFVLLLLINMLQWWSNRHHTRL